jgi:prepilin-type N-terminal cleavage/methylation domain-containing protein
MKRKTQIRHLQNPRQSRGLPTYCDRRAFTLVEIMTVVALTSILLSVAIAFLIGLQRFDAKLRDGDVHADRLAELAELIRTDIRQAYSVSLPTNQSLLIATSTGRQIQYDLTPEGCRRTMDDAGGATSTTDLYRIDPAESWTLETGPPGRRTLHVVRLYAKNETGEQPVRTKLLVQAALGADRFDGGNHED